MRVIQQNFFRGKWSHRYSHGGELRKVRAGRGYRPISTRAPLHLVFKCDKLLLPSGMRSPANFKLVLSTMHRYGKKFFVKVQQFSVQHDHIHILIRTSRRSNLISFMRVFAGQVAQLLENGGQMKSRVTDTPAGSLVAKKRFWKHRPFTRIVRGHRAVSVVRDYIQLNEAEAMGIMRYQKKRLSGLTQIQRLKLWATETIQKINILYRGKLKNRRFPPVF